MAAHIVDSVRDDLHAAEHPLLHVTQVFAVLTLKLCPVHEYSIVAQSNFLVHLKAQMLTTVNTMHIL